MPRTQSRRDTTEAEAVSSVTTLGLDEDMGAFWRTPAPVFRAPPTPSRCGLAHPRLVARQSLGSSRHIQLTPVVPVPVLRRSAQGTIAPFETDELDEVDELDDESTTLLVSEDTGVRIRPR